MVKHIGPARHDGLAVALALVALLVLLPWGQVDIPFRHYLPLHTLIEFASVVVAFLVFATLWYTPSNAVSASWLLIAVALFSAGWLDLAHALSFRGMPDLITPSTAKKSTAFWLAARLIVALTLLGVSFYPHLRRPSRRGRYGLLAGAAAFNLLLLWGVFWHEAELPGGDAMDYFSLKNVLEGLAAVLLLASAWRYRRLARGAGADSLRPLFLAALTGALSGLLLINHEIMADLHNLFGHLFKLLSYGMLFQAMFVASVRKPYDQLSLQAHALAETNAQLRTRSLALSSTAMPVFVTDLAGRVQWRNRAAYALLRQAHPGRAARQQSMSTLLNSDPASLASMRAALTNGLLWHGQVRLGRDGGPGLSLDCTATPLRDDEGAVYGSVITAEDVTKRIAARQRYKRVLDTALCGFWIIGADGRLLEVNQGYANMSGYTVAQLLRMNVDQLEAAAFTRDIPLRMTHLASQGQLRLQSRHRHADGHEFVVDMSATHDPATGHIFVFLHDRSEYEAAAAARYDLERQLLQSQKMQSLGQLTGGIAHDFNNALTAILGYANLALCRCLPAQPGKLGVYLHEIVSASERASELVVKMLTFARMQPGAPAGPLAPAGVIAEVLAMLRPSIPSGIALHSRIDDQACVLIAAGELHQVLVNLIINARDAIGEHGSIEVRVRRRLLDGQLCAVSQRRLTGDYLAIEVRDDGCGIAAEHVGRLFDPFFTTKEVGKGTGLGLSMLQSILRRAGGHVLVETAPGRGSCFQLLFPVAAATAGAAAVAGPAAVFDGVAGAGQQIWVVDDTPAVARYITELLCDWGYRVRSFDDPLQLLAAFRAEPMAVDLVLTDQTMPGIGGLALAAALHRLRPGLPIFLCTGQRAGLDEAALSRCGIQRCFDKPISGSALLRAVALALV
jgi:PAS domain S-box-containing protein